MRKYVFSSAVLTGGIFLTGLKANAAIYQFLGTPTDPAAPGTVRTDTYPEAGFGFYTSTTANQQVNELGFYVDPSDSSGAGVTAVAHTVTLYEYGGNSVDPGNGYVAIAQAVIPAGSAPDASGYAYASIPTINLNNNGQGADYYILTFSAGPDAWYNNGTQTVDSDFGTLTINGWTGGGAPAVGGIQGLNRSNTQYFDANLGYSDASVLNANAFTWVASAPVDFLNPTSWDQGAAPSDATIHLATINNGGTAKIVSGDSVGVLDLYVGDSAHTTAASTGSTNGTLVQSGGVLAVTSNLAIGNAGTGVGTFALSGGTVSSNNFVVGGGVASTTGGVGSVTQTGGAVNVSDSLIVGNEGGIGSYNFSGGTIATSSLIVGADLVSRTGTNGSSGTFVMGSAATLTVTNDLEIGQNFGVGTMNVAGGTLNYTGGNPVVRGGYTLPSVLSLGGNSVVTVSSTMIVGYPNATGGGAGILNISGNASYNGSVWAGYYGGTGTINMTGGSIVASSFLLGFINSGGASGTLNLSGGSIVATTESNIGYYGGTAVINLSGTGSFNQASGFLNLGVQDNPSTTTYFTMNQTGGTLVALDPSNLIFVGDSANDQSVWNMSGGVANTYFPIIGYRGDGSLTIGGTAQFLATYAMNLAAESGSVGTVNLNTGGTLTAPRIYAGDDKGFAGTAAFNLNGGVLIPYSNNDSLIDASFTPGEVNALAGGAIINTNGFNATIAATITSPLGVIGGLTKLGAGTLTLSASNSYTGGTNVSAGQLIFNAPSALPLFTSLTVGPGATATAALFNSASPKNSLFVSRLSLAGTTGAWTGTVDLGNSDMVVRNGSLGTVTSQVAQGYAGGTWLGNAGAVAGGIISTTAAADTTHLTAMGVVLNCTNQSGGSAALISSFDGQPVLSTDILVKYTYYGDANLDGKVDGSDYSLVDNTYTTESFVNGVTNNPVSGWYNGDFNYDGVVNGSDYTLMDNAFNQQGAQISAQLATATAQVGGSSAVPEPATLSLMAIGAAGLIGRRRRRSH